MKIYTRTGDAGETSFIGGRVSKSSELMELIGTLDELNACIGLSVSQAPKELKDLTVNLRHIQNVIFNYGALIVDVEKVSDEKISQGVSTEVTRLEKEIDLADKDLNVLQNFILPGGSQVASYLHLARTVCRRAERRLFAVINNDNNFSMEYIATLQQLAKYFNRLSDWLFQYARWTNKRLQISDEEWNKLG